MLRISVLTLLLLSTNLFADNDDFDPLPAEEPRCTFHSYITRAGKDKPEVLHQHPHPVSANSSLEKLITESCRTCRKALSAAVADLQKQNIFFFQDKCLFDKCSYGESDSALYISEEVFEKALSTTSLDSYYCGTRGAIPTSSN